MPYRSAGPYDRGPAVHQNREGRRNLPPPDLDPPASHEGGGPSTSAHLAVQPRGARFVQLYGRWVVLILPEVVSSCQLGPVRFTPVQARQSSRVTGSAYRSPSFFRSVPEVEFPVGSYERGAFGAALRDTVAVSAARLVHPLAEVVNNSVDGDVRESGFPCGGTRSEVVARRAGGLGAIGARWPLSTGLPMQGHRVDDESSVFPAQGGVRFGVYTGPMQMQKIAARTGSGAFAGVVGR